VSRRQPGLVDSLAGGVVAGGCRGCRWAEVNAKRVQSRWTAGVRGEAPRQGLVAPSWGGCINIVLWCRGAGGFSAAGRELPLVCVSVCCGVHPSQQGASALVQVQVLAGVKQALVLFEGGRVWPESGLQELCAPPGRPQQQRHGQGCGTQAAAIRCPSLLLPLADMAHRPRLRHSCVPGVGVSQVGQANRQLSTGVLTAGLSLAG
jgi:hypothetical protein